MATKTIKQMRDEIEEVLKSGITNRAALIDAVPKLVALQTKIENFSSTVKETKAVLDELTERCALYALEHPSVFDEGLSESAIGVKSGDLTIDDVTYHFVNGFDKPKRIDGGSLSQEFLKGLPVEWVKSGLRLDTTGINRAGVSDEELEKSGLARPDTYEWSA